MVVNRRTSGVEKRSAVAVGGTSKAKKRLIVDNAVVADMRDLLARHFPEIPEKTPKDRSRLVVAMTAAVVRLSDQQERRVRNSERTLIDAIESFVADAADKEVEDRIPPGVYPFVDLGRGEGVGELLDPAEAKRRLAEITVSVRLEDWAGPVAGPTEIERRFGTSRSTLHEWHKRGAVIGILKGERKHVYPLAQFVDGRPVAGMAGLTKVIINPRAAWRWLILDKPSIGGKPLDLLKRGDITRVIDAAKRDFSGW
ncbi:MAG: hypothetical protein FWD68_17960 [Alphaproteobacteria bacterium]|nr:hypothetical protein [Alphaproteobacteria bacterium]